MLYLRWQLFEETGVVCRMICAQSIVTEDLLPASMEVRCNNQGLLFVTARCHIE